MNRKQRRGLSYAKRVADINQIYDTYAHTGLPNREIWKRYIYPRYAISERTFYNLLKAPMKQAVAARATLAAEGCLFDANMFEDDGRRDTTYYRKDLA